MLGTCVLGGCRSRGIWDEGMWDIKSVFYILNYQIMLYIKTVRLQRP